MIFVPAGHVEMVERLALGIEPFDPVRGTVLVHPVRIDIEGSRPWTRAAANAPYRSYVAPGSTPWFNRGPSGRYALIYRPGLGDHLVVRLYDHGRRYVPRRLDVPLLTAAEIEDEQIPYTHRVRRPALFPGAAYDASPASVGLRGRVRRVDAATAALVDVRWAVVEAVLPATDAVVGRARGDDRGEFLLVVDATAAPVGDLVDPLAVDVVVYAPADAPDREAIDPKHEDPYWDLPIEILPDSGVTDDVSAGAKRPEDYVEGVRRGEALPLGRIAVGVADFVFEP